MPVPALVFGGTEMTLQIDNDRTVVDDATAVRLLGHLATLLESMAGQTRLPDELLLDTVLLAEDTAEAGVAILGLATTLSVRDALLMTIIC